MPRKNRPGRARPISGPDADGWPGTSHAGVQHTADGPYLVRTVPGAQAGKAYRCPYCSQQIPAGTAHVVAWPQNLIGDGLSDTGVAERRHWHTGCWRRTVL